MQAKAISRSATGGRAFGGEAGGKQLANGALRETTTKALRATGGGSGGLPVGNHARSLDGKADGGQDEEGAGDQ